MSKTPKRRKGYRFAHTPASPKGLGDYYGTGIRQPIGKMRDDSMGMQVISPTKLKKPPRSLV